MPPLKPCLYRHLRFPPRLFRAQRFTKGSIAELNPPNSVRTIDARIRES